MNNQYHIIISLYYYMHATISSIDNQNSELSSSD